MSAGALVLVVLYRMTPATSPACRTLGEALALNPKLAGAFPILLIDNSPEAHAPGPEFAVAYRHDGANPGLARRYNQALAEAEARGLEWLLLLDQDTVVTAAYLEAMREAMHTAAPDVVAVAPLLVEGGRVQSPHAPLFRTETSHADAQAPGLARGLIRVYNSGAMLRISALRAIGGFPERYWLDYLDHATFHRLQAVGGRVLVLATPLEHAMSIHQPGRHRNPAHAARHRNQLAAERLFYREHGTEEERRLHRRSLVRQALGSLRHCRWAECLRLLRAALARG